MSGNTDVVVMGVFVADLTFHAKRLPQIGETLLGGSFVCGPGGKGSNQAVAAARAGASVAFVTKLCDDTFGTIAREVWQEAGVVDHTIATEVPTGAAMIFVNEVTKDNAIIIVPGAGGTLGPGDVATVAAAISGAKVFLTQLEQPAETALRALQVARAAGVTTVFNPAPASAPIDDAFYPLCDYVTPNEAEAEGLTGIKVTTIDHARAAGDAFLAKGVKVVLLTLGERGALCHTQDTSELVPAFAAGPVVETTGAGDAFNGGLAAGLAAGQEPLDAVRFACAAASISVTRLGTAPSMPCRNEITALLAGPGERKT